MGAPRRYEEGYAQYHFSGPKKLYDEFLRVALREGERASTKIQDFMSRYVKDHGSGNPSFEITQWIDNKDFRAVPTLLSGREKWDRYLSDCQVPELVSIAGAAHLVERIATHYWKERKNTLPGPKTGLEEIQEALDKEKENRT